MAKLVWDASGDRLYETGVDHGVVYIPNEATGVYDTGFAWNGLTAVNETPSGAEPTKIYADNLPYVTMTSLEEFGATIEAFTYPDEFAICDGTAMPLEGVSVGQQPRKTFGFSYRSLVGNDIKDTEFGYKLHLIYGCKAAPSEKAYATVNDSPEAITFSWELSTTPVAVDGVLKPTSILTISSWTVDATKLTALETALYGEDGSPGTEPRLPLPAEVLTMLAP